MNHVVSAKTVVGTGDLALVLEVKGRAVRIKRRGMPEIYVPLESAGDVAKFLMHAAKA